MAKNQNQQNRSNQNRQGDAPRSQKMTGGFSQLSQAWDRSRSQ